MIKRIQNCKNYLKEKAPTWKATILTFLMFFGPRMVAYADISQTSAENGLKKILAFVSWGFMWVGLFLLVIALINIWSALKDEDGERAKKQITQVILSIIVAANRVILNLLFSVIGVGITIPSDPWSAG